MKKVIRKYKRVLIFTPVALIMVMVCVFTGFYLFHPQGRYLAVQGFYQFKIIFNRQSINKIINNPQTDPELRKKLIQVGEIRKFGQNLGLKDTSSYTTVFDTGDRPVAWAVSASPRDRLEPYTWEFPLVGKMPYLGFFNRDDAETLGESLRMKGLDVLIRPVSAYSTLGIFPDPLFSSMLRGSEEYLANTIIHEMTHETIYFKNETNFNESLAVFVGDNGGVEYLKHKYGEDSIQVRNSLAYKEDDRLFSDFMADLYQELDAFYRSPISRDEKIANREEIFSNARHRFSQDIKPMLSTGAFDYFEKIQLDNAYVLFNRRYRHKVGDLEKLHSLMGSDLKKTVKYLKTLKKNNDPQKEIHRKILILSDSN